MRNGFCFLSSVCITTDLQSVVTVTEVPDIKRKRLAVIEFCLGDVALSHISPEIFPELAFWPKFDYPSDALPPPPPTPPPLHSPTPPPPPSYFDGGGGGGGGSGGEGVTIPMIDKRSFCSDTELG